jgi:purine-binding chemotaxis protein CheW
MRRLDWEAAHRRLAAAEVELAGGAVAQTDELERVYRERATLYSQKGAEHERDNAERILLFQVGQTKFGIPVGDVIEVIARPEITPVPGAPPIVTGVIQVRGEIRPVLNLSVALALPAAQQDSAGVVILLRGGARVIGLAAVSVDEIAAIKPEDRRQPAGDGPGTWLTADFTTVLDAPSLLQKLQDTSSL